MREGACQCQRLPLETKLGRERSVSRGYADRLIVLLQHHVLLLQKTVGWLRRTDKRESSRIPVLDNALQGDDEPVQTVKLRR